MKTKTTKAKKSAAPVDTGVVVSASGVARIAGAVSACVKGIGTTGSLIANIGSAARSVANGEKLSQKSIDSILGAVKTANRETFAKQDSRSVENTLSRYRTMLAVYASLPELEAGIRKSAHTCTWHHVYSAASRVKRGTSVKEAIAALVKEIAGKAKGKAGKTTPKVRITDALAIALRHAKGTLHDDLVKLCTKHNLNVKGTK